MPRELWWGLGQPILIPRTSCWTSHKRESVLVHCHQNRNWNFRRLVGGLRRCRYRSWLVRDLDERGPWVVTEFEVPLGELKDGRLGLCWV